MPLTVQAPCPMESLAATFDCKDEILALAKAHPEAAGPLASILRSILAQYKGGGAAAASAGAAPATGSALSTEPAEGAAPAGVTGPYQDALAALLTLGYKATDADKAVRQAADALGPGVSTEELIRKALGR